MVTAKKPRSAAAAPAVAAVQAAVPVPAARRAAQPAPKPMKKAAKAQRAEKSEEAEKAEKARKPKLVRDSFTMPKAEYAVIEELKIRAAKAGAPAKKSELLRAGIKALAAMGDAAFAAAIQAVPALKTGRPAKA